jgi:hypothetical protein
VALERADLPPSGGLTKGAGAVSNHTVMTRAAELKRFRATALLWRAAAKTIRPDTVRHQLLLRQITWLERRIAELEGERQEVPSR